jgi:hypothetical protein
MRLLFLISSVLLLAIAGCKRSEEPAPASATNASSGNPITAPVDYLGAVAQAKKVSEKTLNPAALNNAVQQFNAIEERYPRDIQELVDKGYLAALPSVPPGMKIEYNPQNGQVRIAGQP